MISSVEEENVQVGEETTKQAEVELETKGLMITLDYLPVVSFALAQNKVPVIRKLIIKNLTGKDLENITIHMTASPALIQAEDMVLSLLANGQALDCGMQRLTFQWKELSSLSERISGYLCIEAFQGEQLLARTQKEIVFLAYDQWVGSKCMPEILSAFIMPNVPEIADVIQAAKPFMESWQGNSAFIGYQADNPQSVRIQMAAIFSALQGKAISYCVPPASFEPMGQRIRLPHQMMEQKLGTCLDFALLYAGCLEAIGLHPLVVIMKGHAFAGAWLTKETFIECMEEDASLLTKRAAEGMNQICLVECTDLAVSGKLISFDGAREHAMEHLSDPEQFEFVLDVFRCRLSGIRPMPIFFAEESEEEFAQKLAQGMNVPIAGAAPQEHVIYQDEVSDQEITATRLQVWERSLLDLSLRNILLNFRGNKNAVQLMMPHLEALEDALSKGEEVSLTAIPSDWTCTQKDGRIFEVAQDTETVAKFAENELVNHRLRTYYTNETLQKQMLLLYREARASMEDNGTNTLYLALGFLRWYENEFSEKARYAPVVLYPVEIVRKLQDRSYRIRMRDEEPQINVTLLEMLRQNFGIQVRGLEELPRGEQGLDLTKIFYIIRTAVMAQPRFDVEERAFLGIFSFRQFIMWNDLKNRTEDLLKNKMVRSLMEGHLTWEPKNVFSEDIRLDSATENEGIAVPLSADASQLAAVCAAAKGASFVLHGPPGTGKSQTITNMIANALYQGKTVLFVADKMAALSVVQKRLEKIGLGAFCLELHSNKARKRDVLEQLSRTLELGRIVPPGGYKAKSLRLQQIKDELNEVVEGLHKKRECGRDLFEMIGAYETSRKNCTTQVPISDWLIQRTTEESYDHYEELLLHCIAASKECGSVTNHPFALFQTREYTAMLRDTISTQLKTFAGSLQPLEERYVPLCEQLGYEQLGSYSSIQTVLQIWKKLMEMEGMTYSLLTYPGLSSLEGTMKDLVEQGNEWKHTKEALLSRFSPAILEYNYQDALRRLKEAEESFILFRGGKTKRIVDEVNYMLLNAKVAYSKEDLPELFVEVKKYQDLLAYIQQANPTLVSLMEGYWKAGESDFDFLLSMYHAAMELRTLVLKLTSLPAQRENVLKSVALLASEHEQTKQCFGEMTAQYEAAYREVMSAEESLRMTYSIRMEALHDASDWFQTVRSQVMTWRNQISELRSWVGFLQAYDEANRFGLGEVVQALMDGEVTEDELIPAFYMSLNYKLVMHAIMAEPALSRFRGTHFESLIASFKTVEKDLNQLLIQEMAGKLSAKLPDASGNNAAASSEISILKKAIKSGGRNLSIRKLFQSIPDLLHQMCPCMLMSPMSVAQYMDPSFHMFDLVVFDEASQLPTCEAVGAIARGKETIVVGDPKQLPPTSFFKTQQAEETFEETTLESLLDDCLALSVPQSHLLWHYRSRHESLIAYSNHAYYDSKLFTFPSPNAEESQVTCVFVQGFYDRGKTKQNVAEAQAVVEELVRRARDEKLRQDSVGVVTFSLVQQVLIEDMLEEQIANDPSLELLFQSFPEPVFIKNLENVQGDERDVILFSIGYGPDQDGKVTMNFGPLNADGGWRRLNVAITRARKRMTVFSVLRPEQIDLSRSSSEGIIGLKGFLEYAARGSAVLAARAQNATARPMVTEHWIASMLQKAGYRVRLGVGVSKFKIDIAVVHPKNDKEYLLGIMCDGEMYATAGTAKDRNISQESVLQGLGWKLYRVWILDWLDDPQRELEKLMEFIDGCISKEESVTSEVVTIEESAETTTKEIPIEEPKQKSEEMVTSDRKTETTTVLETVSEDVLAGFARLEKKADENRRFYEVTKFKNSYEPETFYNNSVAIRRMINETLAVEAPISKKMLLKRVITNFGITKASAKVTSTFESVLETMTYQRQISFADNEFIWRDDQICEDYLEYRLPTQQSENKRALEDISLFEISNAIYGIMQEQFSMTQIDIVRETARLFGYQRTGEQMEKQILAGLELAISREFVKVSDDGLRVRVVEKT